MLFSHVDWPPQPAEFPNHAPNRARDSVEGIGKGHEWFDRAPCGVQAWRARQCRALARSPAVLRPDLAHSLRDVVKETVNPPGGRPLCAEARLALQAAQFGE